MNTEITSDASGLNVAMQFSFLYNTNSFLLVLTQTQERADNSECHAITWFSCFFIIPSLFAMVRQQPGCLPKSCPLVTRSSSFHQERKWRSPIVRAGRISKAPAVLLLLNHQENYGYVCLLTGHINHKELVPMITKSTMFCEVSVPTDLVFWPYLLHS